MRQLNSCTVSSCGKGTPLRTSMRCSMLCPLKQPMWMSADSVADWTCDHGLTWNSNGPAEDKCECQCNSCAVVDLVHMD
jgi:hypothetical protein